MRKDAGLTLVEVAVAMGIAAFVLITLVGLLPTGLNSSRDAKDEQAATDILLEIENDIRLTSPRQSVTPRLALSLPSSSGGESEAGFSQLGIPVVNPEDSYFRVRIIRRTPDAPAVTAWHILVEWPATMETPVNWIETVLLQPNSQAVAP